MEKIRVIFDQQKINTPSRRTLFLTDRKYYNMSEALMPVTTDDFQYRTLLFDLTEPITLPITKFNEVWPYVSSVYSKTGSELLQCNSTMKVHRYECRMRRSMKSSTTRVATDKIIKRRNSTIRDKDLCSVRMRVSRLWVLFGLKK